MNTIVVELSRIEAAHLADLLRQFSELLTDADTADPAVARLVPDAYDDAADAGEFRRLTESDLLHRRSDDARDMLDALSADGPLPPPADLGPRAATEPVQVRLDRDTASTWLRMLTALRLVIATRLGIEHDDDHEPGDPRFGVYDWLGYRLDTLVHALDQA